jgi:hypothetical protein
MSCAWCVHTQHPQEGFLTMRVPHVHYTVHICSSALQDCIVPYLSTLRSLLRGQQPHDSMQRPQLKVLQLDGLYEHYCDYSGRRPYMPNPAADANRPAESEDAPAVAVHLDGEGSLQELHLASANDEHNPTMMNGTAMSEAAVRELLKTTNCQVRRGFSMRAPEVSSHARCCPCSHALCCVCCVHALCCVCCVHALCCVCAVCVCYMHRHLLHATFAPGEGCMCTCHMCASTTNVCCAPLAIKRHTKYGVSAHAGPA